MVVVAVGCSDAVGAVHYAPEPQTGVELVHIWVRRLALHNTSEGHLVSESLCLFQCCAQLEVGLTVQVGGL